jgi:hypothetical protein
MILDAATQLAASYSPTLVTANFPPFYLDTLAIADWGAGAGWTWYTEVFATFTSGGAGTLDLALVGNQTDPTFGSGNIVMRDTGVVALATLVKGYEWRLKIDRNLIGAALSTNSVRYITLRATIGTAAMTAGTLNSWITSDENIQDRIEYPAGYTVG